MAFEDIPLIDNHAHPWLRPERAAAYSFARFFTEGNEPQSNTLFYRQAVRELADLLGCEPNEANVVAARQISGYARRLTEDATIEAVLLDDGYPREGAYSVAESAVEGGFRAHRILRLETLAEELIPVHDGLDDLVHAFVEHLEAARPEIVALKSVIAYRSGLIIDPADREFATRALEAVRAAWDGRLVAKPLLEYLLDIAAQWATQHHVPLQIHTGFGDRDLDLRLANPLHLRPLLERGALDRSPVVLLHASYPFVREASYLANVYSNVYVDLSEVSPLLAGPALHRVLDEVLGLAPITRVLYGSDAWGIPDWLWLAARATRAALAHALASLPPTEVRWIAQRVLHDNATELYSL